MPLSWHLQQPMNLPRTNKLNFNKKKMEKFGEFLHFLFFLSKLTINKKRMGNQNEFPFFFVKIR